MTQLKLAPAEIFAKRFEEVEMDWMVGKKALNPVVLMTEAATLYRQLKQTNKWDGQLHPRDQVVVLQTTATALTSKVQELQNKLSSKPAGNPNDSTSSDRGAGTKTVKEFDKRRLTKVENGKEFNAIFLDGVEHWWCEDGHTWNGVPCGMYCTHKPGAGHVAWRERVDKWKQANKERRAKRQKLRDGGAATAQQTPDINAKPPAAPRANEEGKKLALANSLQAVLTTSCGLTPDQFKDMWDKSCAESGN